MKQPTGTGIERPVLMNDDDPLLGDENGMQDDGDHAAGDIADMLDLGGFKEEAADTHSVPFSLLQVDSSGIRTFLRAYKTSFEIM